MNSKYRGEMQVGLMVLDDGEMPTSILEQFPAVVIRHVEAEVGSRPVSSRRPQNWHNDTELIVDMVALGLIMIATTAINLAAVFLWIDSW